MRPKSGVRRGVLPSRPTGADEVPQPQISTAALARMARANKGPISPTERAKKAALLQKRETSRPGSAAARRPVSATRRRPPSATSSREPSREKNSDAPPRAPVFRDTAPPGPSWSGVGSATEESSASGVPGSHISEMSRLRDLTNDETTRLHAVQSEIDQLKLSLQQFHGEAAPLRQGFERLIGAYKQERDDFDALKVAHDKTLSELGIITQVINQLRSAVNVLMSQEKEASSSPTDLETIAKLEESLENKAREAKENQERTESLLKRVTEAESAVTASKADQKELQALRKAASDLREELNEAKFMAEAEASAHHQTRQLNEKMKERIASSSSLGQQAVERSRQAEEEASSLKKEKAALEERCRAHEMALLDSQTKLEEAVSAALDTANVDQESASVEVLEDKLSSVYLELTAAREALIQKDDALRELATVKAKLVRCQEQLAEVKQENQSLRDDAEAARLLKQEAQMKCDSLEDRVAFLRAELKELKEQDVWKQLAQAQEAVVKLKKTAEIATEREKETRRDNALLRLKLAKALGDIDGL